MTAREAILARTKALLNGAGKPAGVPDAVRSRDTALTSADLPAIDFYPLRDVVEPVHRKSAAGGPGIGIRKGDTVQRWLDIGVDCTAKADGATTADAELDEMSAWVTSAIYADDAWSGVATGAGEVETEFLPEVSDVPMYMARVLIRVFYITKAGDHSVSF